MTTHTPDTLDVFAWNAHVPAPWQRVRDMLNRQTAAGRPDVIVLNEVPRHRLRLARWAERHGYMLAQEQPGNRAARVVPEHGSTAVLVTTRRPDLEVLRRRTVVMRLGWRVMSSRRPHRPRRFERVVIRTAGGRWKVTGAHWPTLGPTGPNAPAFLEAMTRTAAVFASTWVRTVVVSVGDHNTSVRVLRPWARAFGAKVAGRGVDSAVVRGARIEHRVLGKGGSDHHAARYTLTRKRRRKA